MLNIKVIDLKCDGMVLFEGNSKDELVHFMHTQYFLYNVSVRTNYEKLAMVLPSRLRIIRNGKEIS